MVNSTALEQLSCFVRDKQVKEMKKWSTRYRAKCKGWYMEKKVKQIREILKIISGGEITEMLKDVLHKAERDALTLPKYKDALINLSENYEKTPLCLRHQLVKPLKNANLKRKDLRDLGFPVSIQLWKNCEEPRDNNTGLFVALPIKVQEDLKAYLRRKSTPVPNSLVVASGRDENKEANRNSIEQIEEENDNNPNRPPVRYIEESVTELHAEFNQKHEMSITTFNKYLKQFGPFKTSHRNLVGQCEHCDKESGLVSKMRKNMKGEEVLKIKGIKNHNLKDMIDTFKQQAASLLQSLDNDRFQLIEQREKINKDVLKFKQFVADLKSYEAILFHKKIAKSQRKAYSSQCENINFLRGKVLIDVDFKRLNISRKNSPEPVPGMKKFEVSCLSFGVHYVDAINEIRCVNFDIFSNEFKQDAQSAINGFKLLKCQDFFKLIDTNNYIFWTNCGKHFRSKNFISFFLRELAERKIHVNLNYFGDKHGESSRDAHFSNITRFIDEELAERSLNSSEQILEAVIRRQTLANAKMKNPKHNQITYGLTLGNNGLDFYQQLFQSDQSFSKKTILIHNLESFYNYQTIGEDYKLVSSILSSNKPGEWIEMKLLNPSSLSNQLIYEVIPDSTSLNSGTKSPHDDMLELDKSTKYYNMLLKKQRILNAIRQMKSTASMVPGESDMVDYENDENFGLLFTTDFFSLCTDLEKTDLDIEDFDFENFEFEELKN